MMLEFGLQAAASRLKPELQQTGGYGSSRVHPIERG
jgi:hypothetical protein